MLFRSRGCLLQVSPGRRVDSVQAVADSVRRAVDSVRQVAGLVPAADLDPPAADLEALHRPAALAMAPGPVQTKRSPARFKSNIFSGNEKPSADWREGFLFALNKELMR